MKKYLLPLLCIPVFLQASCEQNRGKKDTAAPAPPPAPQAVTDSPVKDSPQTALREIEPAVIAQINEYISLKKLTSADELMQEYAPKNTETEGNYTYTVTENDVSGGLREITLTETGLADDSVAARKVIMKADEKDGTARIISIRETYQCRQGRGHTNWDASPCM